MKNGLNMPTPEEIKNLCTEYVNELFAFDDMSDQENIEAKNDAFVMCMAFAGHILEKHSIVSKERINELKNAYELKLTQWATYPKKIMREKKLGAYKCGLDTLKSLFGKSLFEEEK